MTLPKNDKYKDYAHFSPPAPAHKLQKETERMPLEPTKHVNGRMWPPGVSGNPNGRWPWRTIRSRPSGNFKSFHMATKESASAFSGSASLEARI